MTNIIESLEMKVRGLHGMMRIVAKQGGASVIFEKEHGKGFSYELTDAEYVVLHSAALEATWKSTVCKTLQDEWNQVIRAMGQNKTKQGAFARAMSFLAERLLQDEACATEFKRQLAFQLHAEYFRQQREDANWQRWAKTG